MPFLAKLAKRIGIARLATLAAVAVVPACGDSSIPTATTEVAAPDAKASVASAPYAIKVSPSSASGSLGQTAQFTATVVDRYGRTVTNAIASWTSNDPTIVSVTTGGFATAVGVGTTQLIATSGSLTAPASVAVSGVPIATITVTPGSAAGDVGDSAPFTATLRDSNGNVLTGRPLKWTSSAPSIVSVDSTGFARALAPGSATISASSGGLSGSATATVNGATAPAPAPAPTVASIVVNPTSASGNVGDAAQFSATAYDANGNAMTGQTITWSSSNTAVVSVSSSGYATATGPGTANLIATAGGKQGTSTITVLGTATAPAPAPAPEPDPTPAPAPSTGWTNAPSTWGTISDQPFDLFTSLNWFLGSGAPSIGVDLTAPQSASNVLQFTYPSGMAGGSAPATVARGMGGARRVYSGFWFKTNSNWQGHNSNVNKLAFVYMNGSGGDATIMFYGPPGGPYKLQTALEFRGADTRFFLPPNVNNVAVTMGAWHKVEWLVDYGTAGQANGIIKFWMDGTLIGSYTDVLFPADGLAEFQLSPTWGGMGDYKQQTDHLWIDHVFLKG